MPRKTFAVVGCAFLLAAGIFALYGRHLIAKYLILFGLLEFATIGVDAVLARVRTRR